MLNTLAYLFFARVQGPTLEVADDLARWAGGEIGRLPKEDKDRFNRLVESHLGVKHDEFSRISFEPPPFSVSVSSYIWKVDSSNPANYIIYSHSRSGVTPSADSGLLFIVDSKGSVLSRSEFRLGWRMRASDVTYEPVPWSSRKVLVQKMEFGLNGNGPRKIMIGLDGESPHLVRAEGFDNQAVGVSYFAPNFAVGPSYKPPALRDLIAVLKGGNETRRMEALVWLAGCHRRIPDNNPDVLFESLTEAARYAEAIKSKPIADVVTTLRRSPNACVRELAQSVPLGIGNFDLTRF